MVNKRSLLVVIGLLLIGNMSPVEAQDDYQFLLLLEHEGLLFHLDCSDDPCTATSIPLPTAKECTNDTLHIAPVPGTTQVLVIQTCSAPSTSTVSLIDLDNNTQIEYELEPDIEYAFCPGGSVRWSPDGAFIVLNQNTGPGSFVLAFYDPAVGFTSVTHRIGGRPLSFSPDGKYMLLEVGYQFPSEDETFLYSYNELAIAEVAHVTENALESSMLLSDEQMLNGDFGAYGWLSNQDIWLKDRSTYLHYRFDLETNTLIEFESPAAMQEYDRGQWARMDGYTVTILDANSGTVLNELSVTLPIDLTGSDDYTLYWFDPASDSYLLQEEMPILPENFEGPQPRG